MVCVLLHSETDPGPQFQDSLALPDTTLKTLLPMSLLAG